MAVSPKSAFRRQRQNARHRGISWNFTFPEWWQVWEESGKWALRGRGRHGYCMSRFGDTGPYARENVFIQASISNISTGKQRRSSLPLGVAFNVDQPRRPFSVKTMVRGKVQYLGSFVSAEAAHQRYLESLTHASE